MNIQCVELKTIGSERTLRADYGFHSYLLQHSHEFYTFNDLFDFSENENIDLDTLYSDFDYCEIGDVDRFGCVMPNRLNFLDRNLLNESYYKKIEKGDIISAKEDDILLAKVRPNLKKYVRITSENKDVFFTNAFIKVHPKEMKHLLYYCFKTIFYNDLVSVSRQGKGYPTLCEKDLAFLRFDKSTIDTLRELQDILQGKIVNYEREIQRLQRRIKPCQEIIDNILADEFSIDRSIINEIDNSKIIPANSIKIAYNNSELRFSYRWNKAKNIQKEILRMTNCFQFLGKYISNTKNGWSPECNENASAYQVLCLDALSVNGILDLERTKYSDKTKKNFSSYIIKEGDFFVSRGNGTDNKVAVASYARLRNESTPIIYPDIMIRISLLDGIDKSYLAYIINSFVGRLYFKYVSKGGNMKKITAKELNDFILPLPNMDRQREISKRITAEIHKQDTVKNEIERLRNQIDLLVKNTIC